MARDLYTRGEAGNASASEVVRHWDQALISAGLVFVALFAGLMFCLWAIGEPRMGRLDALEHGLGSLRYLSTQSDMDWLPWGELKREPWVVARLLVALVISAAISWWVGVLAARPMSRVRHIEGPQLLEGKLAAKACQFLSHKDGWLFLHPLLHLRKRHWTKHAIIVGSVGAGKTQILWQYLKQLVAMGPRGRKCLIYDVKGDYIAALPEAILVSPWDRRSYVWDISRDLNTAQAASAFASSMIPSKEGDFWSNASQQILYGIVLQLIHDKQHQGKAWGWDEFAGKLVMDPYELKDLLQQHYPAGARLMEDPSSTTALNILQTVVAHTPIIQQLADAWRGERRRKISFRKWAQDDWAGRRQIILGAGPDVDMTSRYVAAIINTLVPNIISPSFPDDEEGRTLVFVLDEFTSLGKLNIGPLIDKGRSKGCTVILGFQAIDQVKEIYGQNFANGLMSMVSTHIICQSSLGETQNMLANLFGRRRVAMTTHSRAPGAMGVSVSQHEEQRQVVAPSVIGHELGVVLHKTWLGRVKSFGIKAIVSIGKDPLLLEFPGEAMPKLRPSFEPAAWTKGVPKREKQKNEEAEEATASPLKRGLPPRKPQRAKEQVEDGLTKLARREGLLP
ncbi:MAG: type IV secretion system DNA-binding domain-containing protein [Pseudomonas sp.]